MAWLSDVQSRQRYRIEIKRIIIVKIWNILYEYHSQRLVYIRSHPMERQMDTFVQKTHSS